MILNDIKALIQGHFTVFKHSFKRRVTLEYPEKKRSLPDKFRGMPCWDEKKCIACKICEKVCPASAINIEKLNDKIKFNLDMSKCIICGNCTYYCPKNAINLTNEYELATDEKSSLKIQKES